MDNGTDTTSMDVIEAEAHKALEDRVAEFFDGDETTFHDPIDDLPDTGKQPDIGPADDSVAYEARQKADSEKSRGTRTLSGNEAGNEPKGETKADTTDGDKRNAETPVSDGTQPSGNEQPEKKGAEAEGSNTETDGGTKSEDGDPTTGSEIADNDTLEKALETMDASVRTRIQHDQGMLDDLGKTLTPYAKSLGSLGTDNPVEAVGRLAQYHDFAMREPDKYLASAAGELCGGDKERTEALLRNAVAHLGFDLVAKTPEPSGDSDDDPFATDAERELRAENAALKARLENGNNTPPSIGIHSPQEQARHAGTQFLARHPGDPMVDLLQPQITATVQRTIAENPGAVVTVEMLEAAYQAAKTQMSDHFKSPSPQPAADVSPDVQSGGTPRSETASNKIIAGAGQSAAPEPKPDASRMSDRQAIEFRFNELMG